MDNTNAEAIRAVASSVEDAIRAAGSIAGRGADMLDGQPGAAEFAELRDTLLRMADHPAMLAVRRLAR